MGSRTAGFVILPSCCGTLKSTRMRTRLPLRSRSEIESLFESDMAEGEKCDGRRQNTGARPRFGHYPISVNLHFRTYSLVNLG
jgi:hypothetical protein